MPEVPSQVDGEEVVTEPSMVVESWPVDRVVPYEKNPRRNDAAVDSVARSIQQYGFRQPIVVDKKGVVIVGHTRLKAAKRLGMTHVPVHVAKDLSASKASALRIADNKTHEIAEWDEDLLSAEVRALAQLPDFKDIELGMSMSDIESVINPNGKDGLTDADDVPDVPGARDVVAKTGDIWKLGDHRVLCGDSTLGLSAKAVMKGVFAEMVWTDPPYGVSIGDKNAFLNKISKSNRITENLKNDDVDERSIKAMLDACFANAVHVCSPGAAWYVAAPAGPLHLLFGEALNKLGIWRQTIQWVKNNATFSPMGVDYHWRAEPIFYGWVPNAGHRFRGGRTQTTVWEIDRPSKSPDHPTMKPVDLVLRAIENSSDAGQVVYDPFLGSGSTLIACEKSGRRCRGIEIEPKYVDVVVRRWEAFTGKKATVIPGKQK